MMTGSCECGMIQFEIIGRVPDVVTCHCSQCRKTSGHVWASVLVPDDNFSLQSNDSLSWRRSSGFAKRGFCTACGSSLFYKHDEENSIHKEPWGLPPHNLLLGNHPYRLEMASSKRLETALASRQNATQGLLS